MRIIAPVTSIVVDGVTWTETLADQWWESERGSVVFGAFVDGAWVDGWFAFEDRDGEGPGLGPFDDAETAMRKLAQS